MQEVGVHRRLHARLALDRSEPAVRLIDAHTRRLGTSTQATGDVRASPGERSASRRTGNVFVSGVAATSTSMHPSSRAARRAVHAPVAIVLGVLTARAALALIAHPCHGSLAAAALHAGSGTHPAGS
jgi:hypothetical protein